MPYLGIGDPDLPSNVQKLPRALRELWIKTFNENYSEGDDGKSFRMAWGVVKKVRSAKKARTLATVDLDDVRPWLLGEKAARTVRGERFSAEAYLHVPDSEKPSTWKLRIEETPGTITTIQLGQAAAALRDEDTMKEDMSDMTPEEKRAYARKMIGMYRKQNMPDADIPDFLWRMAGMTAPKEGEKSYDIRRAASQVEVALMVTYPFVIPMYTFDDHVIVMRRTEPDYDYGEKIDGGVALDEEPHYAKIPYTQTLASVDGSTEVIDSVTFAPPEEWTTVVPVFADFKAAKQDDGRTRWTLITSGNFVDRDQQTFSHAWLEDAIEYAEKSGERGTINIWHIKNSDVGTCDLQLLIGNPGFLLESGLFNANPVGQKAAAYYTEHAAEYGASIEYLWVDRTPEGTYLPPGVIVRRSLLPRTAAAFPWSALHLKEKSTMPKTRPEQVAELAKVMGIDEKKAEDMVAHLESGAKSLADFGVNWKEVDAPVAEVDTPAVEPVVEAVAVDPPAPIETVTLVTSLDSTPTLEALGVTPGAVPDLEVVLPPDTVTAIAQQVMTAFDTKLNEMQQAIATIAQALASLTSSGLQTEAAFKSIEASVKELQTADDAKIAAAVKDLPRATVRALQAADERPTQRTPNAGTKGAGVAEESMLALAKATLYG